MPPPPPGQPKNSPAIRKLARALRDDNKGRERFGCFPNDLFQSTAEMFVSAGSDTLQSINDMQELGRAFPLQGIRKGRKSQPNFPELRLLSDLFEAYGIASAPKCDPGNPRIGEPTIPKEMETWRLGLSGLSGLLAMGREMVIFPTLEMANAKQKRPKCHPYVIPDLSKETWRPFYTDHAEALESWKVLNGSRKKNAPQWTLAFNPGFSITSVSCLRGIWLDDGPLSEACPRN